MQSEYYPSQSTEMEENSAPTPDEPAMTRAIPDTYTISVRFTIEAELTTDEKQRWAESYDDRADARDTLTQNAEQFIPDGVTGSGELTDKTITPQFSFSEPDCPDGEEEPADQPE